MIDETIKALPDGKRMAYVEGHIADYLLAGFTTDDLARVTAERDAWRDAIGKLASTPQAFCPGEHRCICGAVMEWANKTLYGTGDGKNE